MSIVNYIPMSIGNSIPLSIGNSIPLSIGNSIPLSIGNSIPFRAFTNASTPSSSIQRAAVKPKARRLQTPPSGTTNTIKHFAITDSAKN